MSKHDRVFDLSDTDLHLPKRLANRKLFTLSWSEHTLCNDYPDGTLFCTKN
jgi:hypothetical protein